VAGHFGERARAVTADDQPDADEDGGYLWRGEPRLWDNELLMGWYGAVRS
jgi:hypothetical protein